MKMIFTKIVGLFKIVKNKNHFFVFNTSIYSNIRPLLILCKIFVILPLANITGELSDVTFKWKSWEAIFTILFYPCMWLLGLIILYNKKEPTFYLVIPYALVNVLTNICFSFGWNTFINLLKSIDKFDKFCYEFNPFHEEKRLKIYKYLWAMFAACSHLLLVVIYISIYDWDQCIPVGGVCNLILGYFERTQRQIQTTLFLFLSYELSRRFNNLDMITEQFLKTTYRCKNDVHNFNRDLENCRLLYKKLTYCTELFNDAFGFRMFVIICYFFFESITDLLAFMFYHKYYNEMIFFYVTHSFIFVYFSAANADCLQKSSKGIEEMIKKLSVRELPHSTRWQVSHFLHQCDLNKVSISACGIVTIDKKLIFIIISCITTLIIALIQIVPETSNI